jgi:hypothetical protein
MYILHDSARIYRPIVRENEPKNGRFHSLKPAFWACFCELWVYNFGHRIAMIKKYENEYSKAIVLKNRKVWTI